MKRMPASLYDRWLAYYNYSPFDAERGDLRQAMICWVLASIWSDKGHKPKIQDFQIPYPCNKVEEKPQDWREMREMAKVLARIHGKKAPDPMGPLTEKKDG